MSEPTEEVLDLLFELYTHYDINKFNSFISKVKQYQMDSASINYLDKPDDIIRINSITIRKLRTLYAIIFFVIYKNTSHKLVSIYIDKEYSKEALNHFKNKLNLLKLVS